MDNNILRILAFDQSTRCTGVALIRVDLTNWRSRSGIVLERQIILSDDSSVTTITDRFRRLRSARRQIALFVAGLPSIDIVAYEEPPQRGAASTAALHQAIGMFMGITAFEDLDIYAVHASTVKKHQGLSAAARAKVDKTIRGAQGRKIAALKASATAWANTRISIAIPLTEAQDAIADACGVGVGALAAWQEEQHQKEITEAAQGTLPLRRAPSRKK